MDQGGAKLQRRKFLQTLSRVTLGALLMPAVVLRKWAFAAHSKLSPFQTVTDAKHPTPREQEHLITIRLPTIAEDGANVPLTVEMDHPMEPDHYIEHLTIYNFNDPLIGKGTYHFTPANGRVYLSTQLRMDAGKAEVFVVAQCTKDGKWVASRKLKVAKGGC